jgi:hypothetical protein
LTHNIYFLTELKKRSREKSKRELVILPVVEVTFSQQYTIFSLMYLPAILSPCMNVLEPAAYLPKLNRNDERDFRDKLP